MRLLGFLCAIVTALAAEAPSDLRLMVRKSISQLAEDDKNMSAYLFDRSSRQKEFDSAGRVKSESSILMRRDEREGVVVGYVVERDGKPIDAAERARNEERIRKRVAEEKKQPGKQRENKEDYSWIKEIPEALDYKFAGEEEMGGRAVYVLECFPRPGYQASNMRVKVFEKAKGKFWIDKQDSQLVKGDVEIYDTVNVGWGILGRVDKGTRFTLVRQKHDSDNVWLPATQKIRIGARVLLVRNIQTEMHTEFTGFRRRPSLQQPSTASAP